MLMEFILTENVLQFYILVSTILLFSIHPTLSLALKYLSIFFIHVVKIMLSFFDQQTRFTQLLEREGPTNSSLITLSTKKH